MVYWVRSQLTTSTSTSTQARPGLAAGRPLVRMAKLTAWGVVRNIWAASVRLSVRGMLLMARLQ